MTSRTNRTILAVAAGLMTAVATVALPRTVRADPPALPPAPVPTPAPPVPGTEPAPTAEPRPTPPTVALLTREQLKELVGPVALFPDVVLSNLLPASAFPLDVLEAAQYSREQGGKAVAMPATQDWDKSVQGMLQFPDALQKMASDLGWLKRLGRAVETQQEEVLAAIQDFRHDAQAAGNLKSDDKMVVQTQPAPAIAGPDCPPVVVIEPAVPSYVYIPVYDPIYVCQPWYRPWPVFSWGPAWYCGPSTWAWFSFDWGWGWNRCWDYRYNRYDRTGYHDWRYRRSTIRTTPDEIIRSGTSTTLARSGTSRTWGAPHRDRFRTSGGMTTTGGTTTTGGSTGPLATSPTRTFRGRDDFRRRDGGNGITGATNTGPTTTAQPRTIQPTTPTWRSANGDDRVQWFRRYFQQRQANGIENGQPQGNGQPWNGQQFGGQQFQGRRFFGDSGNGIVPTTPTIPQRTYEAPRWRDDDSPMRDFTFRTSPRAYEQNPAAPQATERWNRPDMSTLPRVWSRPSNEGMRYRRSDDDAPTYTPPAVRQNNGGGGGAGGGHGRGHRGR
jgi:hypothetical protein